jgi:hypothetical protein
MKAEPIAECYYHRQAPPDFICTNCQALFCRSCVKVIGSASGGICPLCGSLCLRYKEVMEKRRAADDQSMPFGVEDLRFALRLPLQEKLSLFGLSLVYGAGLFSIPFYLLAEVGVVVGSFGLLPFIAVNAMMFGCASLVIKRLETGSTDGHELFDVVRLLAEIWSAVRIAVAILLSVGWPLLLSMKFGGQSPALRYLAIAWMALYYPAALLIAAFTQSFWATLNPLVGFNAIVKLGSAYVKLLAMYLPVMLLAFAFIAAIAKSVLPEGFSIATLFSFLLFGVIIAPPFFYANMVLASLLGRILFKCGDRL